VLFPWLECPERRYALDQPTDNRKLRGIISMHAAETFEAAIERLQDAAVQSLVGGRHT
jgi:hypothetical protein